MCCWESSVECTGLGLAFACLPLLTAPCLFPFESEPALVVPSLCSFIREMLPFPVSLVQIFGWVDWEVPVPVGARCHLDRTEKGNWRTHGKPSSSPASPPSMGMLTAGVTSCAGVLACFCLSSDSFLLSLSLDYLRPSCFQPNLELFPGGWKGEGQTRSGGCLGVLGGCSPLQSRAGDAPYGLVHGKGTGSQDFSICSLTTLGHLGQVVILFLPKREGRGEGRCTEHAMGSRFCGKGRRWETGAVFTGGKRIICAAGSGV